MKKWFLNAETTLVLILMLGLILKLMHVEWADLILIIGFLTLAFLYLLIGGLTRNPATVSKFSPLLNETPLTHLQSIAVKSTSSALSVVLVGILFQILKWEGATLMLMVGVISGVVCMGLVYFILRFNQPIVYNYLFYRLVPIVFMAASLWYYADKLSVF